MKRVLVAPLDWGLGHATRCIPIILELLDQNCDVFLAGSGESFALLKEEFPHLQAIQLPAYNPNYPSGGSMVFKMISQLPKFYRVIQVEHVAVERIIRDHSIDYLISDNRYGCYSTRIPCVFITHQSNILMPRRFGWLSGIVRRVNLKMIRRFTECWLPDYPGTKSLAGDLLSFGVALACGKHVGPLSRFKRSENPKNSYDVLLILSGPEPQRSILEKIVLPQLQQSRLKYFVVRGKISSENGINDPNVVNFLTRDELQFAIESSALVIARSGYSTIMDLSALGKNAVLVPTPGQTEQLYLAQRLKDQKIVYTVEQDRFELQKVLAESSGFPGFSALPEDNTLLRNVVRDFIEGSKVKNIYPKQFS